MSLAQFYTFLIAPISALIISWLMFYLTRREVSPQNSYVDGPDGRTYFLTQESLDAVILKANARVGASAAYLDGEDHRADPSDPSEIGGSAGSDEDRRTHAITLADLFYDTLKDIFYAERQIVRFLPKLVRAATSPDVQAQLNKMLYISHENVERLQFVFEEIGKRPRARTCEAIQGILEEADEVIAEFNGTDALDQGLIASAVAIAHYQHARFGTLTSWAKQLGYPEVATALQASTYLSAEMSDAFDMVSHALKTGRSRVA